MTTRLAILPSLFMRYQLDSGRLTRLTRLQTTCDMPWSVCSEGSMHSVMRQYNHYHLPFVILVSYFTPSIQLGTLSPCSHCSHIRIVRMSAFACWSNIPICVHDTLYIRIAGLHVQPQHNHGTAIPSTETTSLDEQGKRQHNTTEVRR